MEKTLTKLSETQEQTRTEDELRHDAIYFVCMSRALQSVARGRINAAI